MGILLKKTVAIMEGQGLGRDRETFVFSFTEKTEHVFSAF